MSPSDSVWRDNEYFFSEYDLAMLGFSWPLPVMCSWPAAYTLLLERDFRNNASLSRIAMATHLFKLAELSSRRHLKCAQDWSYPDLGPHFKGSKLASPEYRGHNEDLIWSSQEQLAETQDLLYQALHPAPQWKPILKDSDFTAAVDDMRDLVHLAERDLQRAERERQDLVGDFEYEQAIDARHQTRRTRWISYLAFFFNPLSFITSFFGMNVDNWVAGSLALWIPLTSSAGLRGCS